MAMPSGNVLMSDKMQFSSGGGGGGGGSGGGGEIHNRQWFPDERDGFISWLRGEFAASNAIIDSLCHHLRSIGEPGEYDAVIGCIQQRRCNWNPVLHMQQYFSVAEVMYALQQVAWRKQQKNFDQMKAKEKDFKKSASYGVGSRQGNRTENVKENFNSNSERHYRDANSSAQFVTLTSEKGEEKTEKGEEANQRGEGGIAEGEDSALTEKEEGADGITKTLPDISIESSENPEGIEPEVENDVCISDMKGPCNALPSSGADTIQNQDEKQNLTPVPRTFLGTEIIDGKAVNVVEGLKLYEGLFDGLEISKIVLSVNELRAAGRRGQLQGQTFMVLKRPMKGHGREIIQLGLPIADAPPEDENMAGTSKDRKIEAIPGFLLDVIDRLVHLQVTNVKPDSCIIDFFNEGDHSQPHTYPYWFGRPVCILSLTESDMTFGKVIGVDHPGEYRGSLKFSLAAGSLLTMQGKSADFAKHAISSLRKHRILVTFTKAQPKKTMLNDGSRLPISISAPPSHWGPPLSRPPSYLRHPANHKHYGTVPTTGVLPAPPIRPQHPPPPNSMQPLFVTTPVAPTVPYPTPVPFQPTSAGWATVTPPRHPTPRLPVPGTGVFLPPPGSGHPPPPQQLTSTTTTETEMSPIVETPSSPKNENGSERLNCNSIASPKGKLDGKGPREECNGDISNGGGGARVVGKEEQPQSSTVKKKVANKPTAAVK